MAKLSLRQMIDRLVATPSVSALDPKLDMPNRPIIDLLAEWLEHEGFAVELLELPGNKANLIATRGRGPGGLVLSGHTDTVPFDEGKWSGDPFRVREKDGALYGLGVCDMKSFLALAIEAARAFDDADLKEPLIVLATADEECGMDGARALVEAGKPRARRAIIGEPTGLTPVRMHKGCAMERLELTGRSGHSSDPRYGASALDASVDAIGAMRELRSELARDHVNEGFEPPTPTMSFGRIEGGDSPNRICARCTLDYDMRLLPGMDLDALRGEIHRRVARAIDGSGVSAAHSALTTFAPAFETPATAEIVRAVEGLTGHAAIGVSFGTEAPYLTALGMDTVVLGPGDISVAHQPDEHLPLAHVDPAIATLRGVIERFCVQTEA